MHIGQEDKAVTMQSLNRPKKIAAPEPTTQPQPVAAKQKVTA